MKQHKQNKPRNEKEMPLAVENWGWKYHHLGVPTRKKIPGETYLPRLRFHVADFRTSPFGID